MCELSLLVYLRKRIPSFLLLERLIVFHVLAHPATILLTMCCITRYTTLEWRICLFTVCLFRKKFESCTHNILFGHHVSNHWCYRYLFCCDICLLIEKTMSRELWNQHSFKSDIDGDLTRFMYNFYQWLQDFMWLVPKTSEPCLENIRYCTYRSSRFFDYSLLHIAGCKPMARISYEAGSCRIYNKHNWCSLISQNDSKNSEWPPLYGFDGFWCNLVSIIINYQSYVTSHGVFLNSQAFIRDFNSKCIKNSCDWKSKPEAFKFANLVTKRVRFHELITENGISRSMVTKCITLSKSSKIFILSKRKIKENMFMEMLLWNKHSRYIKPQTHTYALKKIVFITKAEQKGWLTWVKFAQSWANRLYSCIMSLVAKWLNSHFLEIANEYFNHYLLILKSWV